MRNLLLGLLFIFISGCYFGDSSDFFEGKEIAIKFKGIKLLDTLKADGESELYIYAETNPNVDEKFKNILFQASDGEFVGSTTDPKSMSVRSNSKGVAFCIFKVPQNPGKIYFTASIGDNKAFRDDTSIILNAKYPDTLIIENESNTLFFGVSMNLTTYLVAYYGKPSLNTYVAYDAYQLDSKDSNQKKVVGRFTKQREAFSNSESKVTVQYTLDSLDNKDVSKIYIRAMVKKTGQSNVSSIISLPVRKK